jgi:hypothetical protein
MEGGPGFEGRGHSAGQDMKRGERQMKEWKENLQAPMFSFSSTFPTGTGWELKSATPNSNAPPTVEHSTTLTDFSLRLDGGVMKALRAAAAVQHLM